MLNQILSAGISETEEISNVQNFVTNDSLVLLNITGTLYEPATTLADNQWRIYFTERVHTLVSDRDAADRWINKIKNEIVNHLPKKPVEEFTSQFVSYLQNEKISVLGITQKQMATAYADNFGLITKNHLLSININLENTLSYLNVKGEDPSSHSLAYGIIFTNKKPVGPAILAFLDRLETKPSKIIMVDNTLDCLKDAEETLMQANIPFEGFRYSHSDHLKTDFDPVLGHIQFFAFMKERQILSDEEAKLIKESNPDTDYDALLDKYILENAS
jgi:hypothetical protein